jgi:Protein of unknown function (DUF2855)
MTDFLVKRDDLRQCRLVESAAPEVGPGQALLRVETFGLTANNVTYAVFGEAMNYWDFFPAEQGWGRVPMWGFATVERSEVEGVEEGTRLFGYLPPSSHLLVTPVAGEGGGFVDGSPHRAALPSVYHRFTATATDPFYREDTEAMQMLLRPLFYTSFLIDDQLADDGLTEQGPIVLSSASSKTALAAAHPLAQREAHLIGLTSARNLEFVEGLGIYAEVVAYDEIGSLDRGGATFVDFAGDADVRHAVHSHYGDDLFASVAVGMTHWEALTPSEDELPGPAPAFFFAPDRIVKRSQDWGRDSLAARVAEAWHPFCEWSASWLEPVPGEGFEGVREAYLDVLDGGVPPNRAHVLSLS